LKRLLYVAALANNNLLALGRFLPDNRIRSMLTSDQINDLRRLYWSERWPIRKIERHLGCRSEKS
jgi:hypothetical protein